MFRPDLIENKFPVDQLRQTTMIEHAESIKSRGYKKVAKIEELNAEEVDCVAGGGFSIVDHVGIDPNTGQLVEYDRDGNIIPNDVGKWY